MKRTKGEIIAKILEVCLTASSKTNVVYGSNLNFRTVNLYLDALMMNGHITRDENTLKYKTTEKGKELLAIIKEAHEIF